MTTTFPISDILAETSVIGSMLQGASVADEGLALLPIEAITNNENRAIYAAIRTLRDQHIPIDLIAVHRELRQHGQLISLDSLVQIAKSGLATATNVAYHARHVLNCYQLQLLVDAADTLRQGAYNGLLAEDVIGNALTVVQSIANLGSTNARLIEIGESAMQVWDKLNAGGTPGIPTGFRDIDALTGGWHTGDLNLLAARPGIGKTALGLNFALNVARQGVPVFFASLEMAHMQLTQRVLGAESKVGGQDIRLHRVREHEMDAVYQAAQSLLHVPITIYDKSAITTTDLRTRVSIWRNRVTGPCFLIADYLQLMRGLTQKGEGRVQEVGDISRTLKAIARDLDIPVLAMSQLSRSIEGRTDHKPMLSDLRESGSLEQDADMVMFIHRDEVYDQNTDKKGIADLLIEKHRNGPVGMVPLRFNAALNQFSDLTYRSVEGY